jgi:predicted nucleotidyltransferase
MLPLEELFGERLSITVLRLLTQVEGGMSGNAIARRLALQQSAVRKALERLVARGVVTRVDIGRSASYALDTRREVVRRLVLPVFQAEAALGERLRETLRRAAEQLRPAPAAVVLYGSVAREARAPGDVDLLVVLHQDEDEEPVRSTLLDAVRGVEVRFQVAVNPVVLTIAELHARAADPLITAVAAEGVLLAGQPVGPLRRVRRLQPPAPAAPQVPPLAPRSRRSPRNAG